MMITKIWMDPHAGEVAVGRIYSGAISQGESVFQLVLQSQSVFNGLV